MRMRRRAAVAAFLSAVVAVSAQAAPTPLAATLRITVDGITAAGGTLRVGLYDEATFALLIDAPLFKREAKAASTVVVTFERLPPGSYAIKAFQDVNNDGKAQAGEPFGISNSGSKDNFDAAAIVLEPGNSAATIHLR